jgi:uncharacterized protein YcnI
MRRALIILALSALLFLVAAPALAHVTVSPMEAGEDDFATLAFRRR